MRYSTLVLCIVTLSEARGDHADTPLLLRSLSSLPWLQHPLLQLLLPAQPQQRTLSLFKSPSHSHRSKAVRKQPYSISNIQPHRIRGYETFTLDEHIRAKPDVIHYVDSPKIYGEERSAKSTDGDSSLVWTQEGENKFIVKRNPGQY